MSTTTPPYSAHTVELVAHFSNGSPVATLRFPLVGSWGLRHILSLRVKSYHIKTTGSATTTIPDVVFLTTSVPGLFPRQSCISGGASGTMECLPITVQPHFIDATGNVVSAGGNQFIHDLSGELVYSQNSRNNQEITIPSTFQVALGLAPTTSLTATLPAPYDWPCSTLLNVAGDSSVTLEMLISHQGERKSFPQKQAIGFGGHTSNI